MFCLTDGGMDFGAEVFRAFDAATLAVRFEAAGDRTIRTQFNCFVIRQGSTLTLVDTGCGALFGPVGGQLHARHCQVAEARF